ncbi:hypothetical protein C4569_01740 [Candidatus Parcubacteria bacterium]|nr:MAG: hypothetical protein C4569_01740 [Candidatus Parcubacteria bacterium]
MLKQSEGSQLSGWQLKLGYWYVSNKLRIKKIFIILLIVLDVLLLGISAIYAVVLLLIQAEPHSLMLKELNKDLVNYNFFHEKNKLQNIEQLALEVIRSSNGKYDLAAVIRNPNKEWQIENFHYQFVSGADVISEGNSFILPGQEKYIAAFGVEKKFSPGDLMISVSDINWRRIDDFQKISSEKMKFEFNDINFLPAGKLSSSGRYNVSQSRFQVKNNSAYNFWLVGFYVVLYSGSNISGISFLNLEDFSSLETKSASVNWDYPLPTITKTEIVPEINILDQSVFRKN